MERADLESINDLAALLCQVVAVKELNAPVPADINSEKGTRADTAVVDRAWDGGEIWALQNY